MQSVDTLKVYEIGKRGKPVANIGPGDLAQPSVKGLWQRVVAIGRDIVEIARESRALEERLLGQGRHRRSGDY